jgi:hypothetical protein
MSSGARVASFGVFEVKRLGTSGIGLGIEPGHPGSTRPGVEMFVEVA